jgi:hypothetical protein
MIQIAFGIASLAVLAVMVICAPQWLDDGNTFLKTFVGVEFLGALGVILAITLASLAQLHLSLNEREERRGVRFLDETHAEIRSSGRWLIGLYIGAVAVVVTKPLLGTAPRVEALMNALALAVLGFYILILFDITSAVFSMEPDIGEEDHPAGGAGEG